MTDFKKVSLQFLRFLAANYFCIIVFVHLYLFCVTIFLLIKESFPKFLTCSWRSYFIICGIIPFAVSAFLIHYIYRNMVFDTNEKLTLLETFKEVIVFGCNFVKIALVVVVPMINILSEDIISLRNLIFVGFAYVISTIVYFLINKLWIFKKSTSED